EIRADPTPRLACLDREVEGRDAQEGETRQDRVAAGPFRAANGRARDQPHPELLREIAGLLLVDLLDADYVCIDAAQDLQDSLEIHAPIEASTFVNIVGRDPHQIARRGRGIRNLADQSLARHVFTITWNTRRATSLPVTRVSRWNPALGSLEARKGFSARASCCRRGDIRS